MANVNRSFGARPVKHLNGSPYNGQANIYELPAADSSVVMVGDFVVLSDQAAADRYPAIERAGSGSATVIVGSVVGFVIDATALNTPQHRAASTKRYALVADSPDLLFEMQEDSVGGAIALASTGLNVEFTLTAGSTTTGNSGMEIDSSSVATTATLPLQIMGSIERPDNETATAEGKFLVRINTHAFGWAGIAGV